MISKLLAALALLAALLVLPVSPASANPYWCGIGLGCGSLYHTDDAGYDAGIIVACDYNNLWGSAHRVPEYSWDSCHDVDAVYADWGTRIVCREAGGGGWYELVRHGNWRKISDWDRLQCVNQLL